MNKFEILTKYIPQIKTDNFGEWIEDHEHDGTIENPNCMPYVQYSDTIDAFIHDVYRFKDTNKDFELERYREIMQEYSKELKCESVVDADPALLNERCITALIMYAMRAEHFCDGALIGFLESGKMVKWLERLYEIDNAE